MSHAGIIVVRGNETSNALARAERAASELGARIERIIDRGRGFDALSDLIWQSSLIIGDEVLDAVAVFEAEGRALYAFGHSVIEWPGARLMAALPIDWSSRMEERLIAVRPVRDFEGATAYYAVVSVDRGVLEARIAGLIRAMIGMGLALLAVVGVLQGFVLARRVGIPLRGLVRAADTLATGEVGGLSGLERRTGSDDIGRIYVAFARLVGGLVRARDELAAQNANLEAMVERRTEELRRAKEEAESANRAKSAFLASMSHDIRTPMNSVLGYLDLLAIDLEGEEKREYVSVIRSNARYLLALIDDILDFSKIESGRLEMASAPFSPSGILGRAVRMLAPKAAEKGIELSTRAGSAPMCRGDGFRLAQVLVNLIGNAVKFTPERGRIEATLESERAEGGARLYFSVSDTGIGIAPDKLGSIFKAFEQADADIARRYGGSGLGLAIASRIVRLMGGELGVESEVGKGSRFRFSILLPEAEPGTEDEYEPLDQRVRRPDATWATASMEAAIGEAPADAASGPAAAGKGAVAFDGLSALIAEDTKDSRVLLTKMLELLGFAVDAASDGAEALALCAEKRYDLVVLDDCMPVMDGLETLRRLRSKEGAAGSPRIPVIAQSAAVLAENRDRFLLSGADDFIPKPVSMRSLAAAIGRVLEPGAAAGRMDAAAEISKRIGVDWDFASELVAEFSSSLRARTAAIEDALGERDRDRLTRAAHSLRGSALILRSEGIAEAARSVEEASAKAAWPEAVESFGRLSGAVRDFLGDEACPDSPQGESG